MGKKKAFIDKKTAATYQLICRENGDEATESGETGAAVVLARTDVRHTQHTLRCMPFNTRVAHEMFTHLHACCRSEPLLAKC